MPNATLRLFFALWPAPPTRAALAALAQVLAGETGGRATAPANIHLTLAFLGARPPDSVADLVARASAITASPF
ncbi:MAG: 2'-5' RNA ligase family protein, partial [Casimicrobiaceae bacterium]